VEDSLSVQKTCYALNSISMNFFQKMFRSILALLVNVNDVALLYVTFFMNVIKVLVD
jgi:hypothetical protein